MFFFLVKFRFKAAVKAENESNYTPTFVVQQIQSVVFNFGALV